MIVPFSPSNPREPPPRLAVRGPRARAPTARPEAPTDAGDVGPRSRAMVGRIGAREGAAAERRTRAFYGAGPCV